MATNSVSTDQTVSLGDWILTMILSGIPLVGLIMLFVWAFGGGAKASKQNYARAVLILAIIGIILGVLSSILFAGIFTAIADNMQNISY